MIYGGCAEFKLVLYKTSYGDGDDEKGNFDNIIV